MSSTQTTSPAPIGSASDRALDAATRGKVGTVRRGFHQTYTQVRLPGGGVRNDAARCTCTERYSHVAR